MPRGPRTLPPKGVIHFIVRSNNHLPICKDSQDFKELITRLVFYNKQNSIDIYHYVLMNTHIHLLAYMHDVKTVASNFKAFQLSYFHYFKKKYSYDGHLWHGRYKSVLVSQESHFLQAGRYIELNPVKANLVRNPLYYPWCSYQYYAKGERDLLVTPNPAYFELGETNVERRLNYQRFIFSDECFTKFNRDDGTSDN